MHGRYLHILIVVTRLAASTLLVPVALVAGLLTFPSTCQCGADLPHAHGLFGMSDHHHGGHDASSDDTEVVRSGQDGVTIQAPAGSALQSLSALHTADARLLSSPRTSLPTTTVLVPDGLRAVPDVPPPRA